MAVHREHYGKDEKLQRQVVAARKLLSDSLGCQMQISEVCNRPGGGVLQEILETALEDQAGDMRTAQEMLRVLDELAAEDDFHELRVGTPGVSASFVPAGKNVYLEDVEVLT